MEHQREMEAPHRGTQLNKDFRQAIILDGDWEDAMIIGVEYFLNAFSKP